MDTRTQAAPKPAPKDLVRSLKPARSRSLLFPALVVLGILAAVASALAGQVWLLLVIFLLMTAGLSAIYYLASAPQAAAKVEWETKSVETQREDLNIEVKKLARLLDVSDEQLPDLLSAYIVAEDLALRQIQHEQEAPLLRHVIVGDAAFDAVMVKDDALVCVDASFLVAPEIRQEKLDAVLRKASAAQTYLRTIGNGLEVKLLLLLITQLTPDDEKTLARSFGTRRFKETTVNVDIRLLDFESLQKTYFSE